MTGGVLSTGAETDRDPGPSPLTCRGVQSYSDSLSHTHPGGAGASVPARGAGSVARRPAAVARARRRSFHQQGTANVRPAFAEVRPRRSTQRGTTGGDARVARRTDRRQTRSVPAGRIVTRRLPSVGASPPRSSLAALRIFKRAARHIGRPPEEVARSGIEAGAAPGPGGSCPRGGRRRQWSPGGDRARQRGGPGAATYLAAQLLAAMRHATVPPR